MDMKCTRGNAHRKVSVAEFEAVRPPVRSPSPGASKAAAPKKGARAKPRDRDVDPSIKCCYQYLREGKCDIVAKKGKCNYPHVSRAEYDAKRKDKEKSE